MAVAYFGGGLNIYLGTGTGTFTAGFSLPYNFGVQTGPAAVSVADFNGDGRPDLALVGNDPAGKGYVTIFLGSGDGTFTSPSTTSSGGLTYQSIALGDFNQDGRVDLAITSASPGGVNIFINAPPAPDLIIFLSHSGTFTQGQLGSYTLSVSNVGISSTSGLVIVTFDPSLGVSTTAISGSGWNCTVATATCTRSDALAGSASYPPITVTVSVAADAPTSVTNVATVAGGGETNTSNDTASDVTSINITATPQAIAFAAPTSQTLGTGSLVLTATASSGLSSLTLQYRHGLNAFPFFHRARWLRS